MHSADPKLDLTQAANQALEMARSARQERIAIAFQAISAVNMAVSGIFSEGIS
jgi:hypothetical protein